MEDKKTNIQISVDLKEYLESKGSKSETYEDIIRRLIKKAAE